MIIPTISSIQDGRGFFNYYYTAGAATPYLELVTDAGVLQRTLQFATPSLTAQNTEVYFTLLNPSRVLEAAEDLQIQFTTNYNVIVSEPYLVQVKVRDQVLYQEQIVLNARAMRNMTIPSRNFPIANGGVLSLSLYRLSNTLQSYVENPPVVTVNTTNNATNTTSSSTTLPDAAPSVVQQWFIPKGEILFFKRPDETLKVTIKTNKGLYLVGDKVDYTINIVSTLTNKPVTDSYVSIVVTDDNSFAGVPASRQALPLTARVFLGNEVQTRDIFNTNALIDTIVNGAQPIAIDLLLGVQGGFRNGAFDLAKLLSVARLTPAERQNLESLYGVSFTS